ETGAAPAAPGKRKPAEAARLVAAVIAELDEDGDGWVTVSGLGDRLRNAYPDFDQRTYGHAKLSDLLRATGRFDVQTGAAGGAMRIRDKA
ncbi:MAG: OST-HTH/LOTUS domain-containing protein, partial [Alphaproteobacteria bacterium]|nr:OST-HTH/LOTUS domain-containing protein [Alphaproteobacteria bacterium]